MLGLGKVTCSFCGARVRRRDARKAQEKRGDYICETCYAVWDKSGRNCAACNTRVSGMQDLGLFVAQKGLGHADCGGVRVLRA